MKGFKPPGNQLIIGYRMEQKSYLIVLSVLFLLAWNALAAEEPARIDSVVYDLKIGENRFDGFCQITLESNTTPGYITFMTDADVEVNEGIFGIEKTGNVIRLIPPRDLKTDAARRIILRIRGRILNHSLEMPLIRFPYRVDNTLIAVSAPNKKFVWIPGNASYPPENENPEKVLASDDFREEDLLKLNSEYLYLRSASTKSLSISEYRFYLGSLEPGEKHSLSCWAGTVYDYYAWQTILAVVLSLGLVLAVYIYSKKRRANTGEDAEGPAAQENDPLKEERMKKWKDNLSQLEGDESTVYWELLESNGEMLQKKICEKTGFSSVKTTRVLDRLEQKNLIERKSYGVTNKVVLR